MPSTPVLQNFATVSFPLLSGNPNYTQQRAVSPYLVAHLPIFFANFFGDEFAAVLSHHVPQQCSPCAIAESLSVSSPIHSSSASPTTSTSGSFSSSAYRLGPFRRLNVVMQLNDAVWKLLYTE